MLLKVFELFTILLDIPLFVVYVDFLRFWGFFEGILILLFCIMPRGFDPPPFLVVWACYILM